MLRVWFLAAASLFAVACAAPGGDESSAASALESRAAQGARVCSWNLRRLGHKFDGKEKNVDAAASVIRDNCDVIAIQEVMQAAGGSSPGYTTLVEKLGADWSSVLTKRPAPDTTSPNSERYAFYWRKSEASLCEGWTAGAVHIKDDEDTFLREPGYTCIKVRAHSRELMLVGYHALYGSLADRKREVGFLGADLDGDGKKDDVVRQIRAARPHADVVLVGDFNLTMREMAAVLPTYKDLTNGSGSTINADNAVTDNQFDHLLLAHDEPLASELEPAEVLDVRSVVAGNAFFQTVSDHLPIRFRLGKGAAEPPPAPVEPITESPYGPGSALPAENGAAPSPEFVIKGNEDSMLYHTIKSPYWRTTKAEVWFKTEDDAKRAGFKRWRE